MKILIFTTHFYPYLGGLEKYVLELSKRLIKKGISVDIITFNDKKIKEFENYEGINIYRLPCWNVLGEVYSIPRLNKKTRTLLKKLSEQNYDFVNTHTRFFTSSWLGMCFAKKYEIKLIHAEHGNTFVQHPNKLIEIFARVYDQTIGRKIFKNAWKVIGVSKPCIDFAIKLGANRKKTTIVHNSIDITKFKSHRKINKEIKKIVFVGRLIKAKGLTELISSVKKLNVELHIVGDGPSKKELKKLSLMLDVKTTFYGFQEETNVKKILAKMDLFVNPSYSEGLPTSVLEAGAMGLPVIATDVGGTNEIILDSTMGWLIKPKNIKQLRNKIKQAIDNLDVTVRKGKKLQKHIIANFNWNKTTETFIELLSNKF
ncbi:glycosyltransferase family 4 protein [Candidatus Woesearchaeota archaeon]|jgi:glycosyltransferase involved in cell wall biosynthesis|nr:glycosyltransferase family 4 protein [Candidatus Woesearchaeota archaeon]